MSEPAAGNPQGPIRQIIQPFIDIFRAPRALWGLNLGYFLEGLVYFGVIGYLAMYFNEYVGLDDVWAGRMVGVLTAGITVAMFFFGGLSDKLGLRTSLLAAFVLLLIGRVILSAAPYAHLKGGDIYSPMNLTAMAGVLLVVLGYGMYQPAAYAGVRQLTSEKTAGMAYAMLYALMNLGGWLPSFAYLIRDKQWLGAGISGTFWVYTGITFIALIVTHVVLSRRVVDEAIRTAEADRQAEKRAKGEAAVEPDAQTNKIANDSWLDRCVDWFANHPLMDTRFTFFIFALVPVQTLFAHNWLTLPMYVERGFRDSWPWISRNFEPAVNFNPLLIFVLVPIVTALTQKRNVYNMMIAGTFVMGAPTFLLAVGPRPWTLLGYLILMTVGEAMWQPRFLQYAAEIAPKGRTGAYMGVAQFPWFLTKMIVPFYSGWFLQRYCPEQGPAATEKMWLIYGVIAMGSTVLLIAARPWMIRGFKTKSDE